MRGLVRAAAALGLVGEQAAQRGAGAVEARTHRADRGRQAFGDARVVEAIALEEFERGALVGGQGGERTLDALPEFVGPGDVQRVVAAAVQVAVVVGCVLFVTAAAQQGSAQVQAAVNDRTDQPAGKVLGDRAAVPQRQQRLLQGVSGEVVASEQAPRDRADRAEMGGEQLGE